MFNIAMISRWHPHAMENRYVNQLKDVPGTRITCVWDFDEKRGQNWAKELGVDFEKDLDKLLAREDVDGVCITAPTDMHKDIIIKAARAGKHVFTEKALAMNYKEALEIKAEVEKAGIKLGVVFPRRANREYLYAKKLYDAGEFGTVALMRVRNAVTINAKFEDHWFKSEPIGGGGAIRDLGCHNIDLACWILGEPQEVNTMTGFTRGFAVDDTGVCNIKFKNGAVAMVDSSFSEPLSNNWYSFEMYGSKMAFIADTEKVIMIKNTDTDSCVSEKEIININSLPEGHKIPLAQWVDACTNGSELVCDIDAGVLVNRVLDAAAIASEEKRTVEI